MKPMIEKHDPFSSAEGTGLGGWRVGLRRFYWRETTTANPAATTSINIFSTQNIYTTPSHVSFYVENNLAGRKGIEKELKNKE